MFEIISNFFMLFAVLHVFSLNLIPIALAYLLHTETK